MAFTDNVADFWPISSLLPCPEGAKVQHSNKARQTLVLPEVFSTPCNGHTLLKRVYIVHG